MSYTLRTFSCVRSNVSGILEASTTSRTLVHKIKISQLGHHTRMTDFFIDITAHIAHARITESITKQITGPGLQARRFPEIGSFVEIAQIVVEN